MFGAWAFIAGLPLGPKDLGVVPLRVVIPRPNKRHHALFEVSEAAMEALLLVAEHDGPTLFAGIGVMRALYRHKPKAKPAPR